jgi:hypothetical protein
VCVVGTCEPKVCEPFAEICRDGDVFACDGLGLAYSLKKDCDDVQDACNPKTVQCQPRDCEPKSTFCEENVARSCDDDGFYSGTPEDCGNLACALGRCVDCTTIALRDVLRLDGVGGGSIAISDMSSCAVDVAGVRLQITYVEGTQKQLTAVLPSKLLPPNGTLVASSHPEEGWLGVDGMDAIARFDSTVALCDGDCAASTTFDLVQFGLAPPPLPSPLSFNGLLAPNLVEGYAYRDRFDGKNPSFLSRDWSVSK